MLHDAAGTGPMLDNMDHYTSHTQHIRPLPYSQYLLMTDVVEFVECSGMYSGRARNACPGMFTICAMRALCKMLYSHGLSMCFDYQELMQQGNGWLA